MKTSNFPSPESFISEICQLRLGDEAMKIGRSTGFTVGTFSYIKSVCRIPGLNCETSEWCFVGDGGHFADRGDSGSFVLRQDGALGGLLFSGSSEGHAYVTPIQDVIEDIEQRLECTVKLPNVE